MAVELGQARIASSTPAWQEAPPPFKATTEGLVKFGRKMDLILDNAQFSPVRVVFFAKSTNLPMVEVHMSATESFSMPAHDLSVGLGMGGMDLAALKGEEVQELFDRCTIEGEPLYIEYAENGEVARMLFDTDEQVNEWNWMKEQAKQDEEYRNAMIDMDLQDLSDARINDDLETDDYTTPEAQTAIERDIQMAEAKFDPETEIWAQFDAREEEDYNMTVPKHSDYELERWRKGQFRRPDHFDSKRVHWTKATYGTEDRYHGTDEAFDRGGRIQQREQHPYAQRHRDMTSIETPSHSHILSLIDERNAGRELTLQIFQEEARGELRQMTREMNRREHEDIRMSLKPPEKRFEITGDVAGGGQKYASANGSRSLAHNMDDGHR